MAALPSLRQLSYLVVLAETLHFTDAAKRCFVTQSTLSGGIMELERVLGGALVERNRQNVRLTPLGQQVVERARLMLADAHDLMSLAQQMSEPLTGELHLGVIPTIAPFMVADLLGSARTHMPRLKLHIHEVQSQTAVEQLEGGQLDMVLLALPFLVDGLHVQALHTEQLHLVCHEDDTWANMQTLDLAHLSLEQLLLLEEGHCLRDHALSTCALGDRATTSDLQTSSLPTLMQLVQARLGFSLLPHMAVVSGFLKAYPHIQSHPLQHAPTRTIALLTRKSSTQMIEFEKIAEILKHLLGA